MKIECGVEQSELKNYRAYRFVPRPAWNVEYPPGKHAGVLATRRFAREFGSPERPAGRKKCVDAVFETQIVF